MSPSIQLGISSKKTGQRESSHQEKCQEDPQPRQEGSPQVHDGRGQGGRGFKVHGEESGQGRRWEIYPTKEDSLSLCFRLAVAKKIGQRTH